MWGALVAQQVGRLDFSLGHGLTVHGFAHSMEPALDPSPSVCPSPAHVLTLKNKQKKSKKNFTKETYTLGSESGLGKEGKRRGM